MDEAQFPSWQSLTSVEAEEFAELDPVVILPVAGVEQHGPHLPLSTDLEIGLGLLRNALGRLPADFPVRVLPPQAVGASPEHASFPGTLDLDPECLAAVTEQLGAAVARSGIRRLVLHNSHGGNRHILRIAALRLRQEHGLFVVTADYTRFPRPASVDLPEEEWTHGLHGGAVETAMMMHLRPELVSMDRAPEPHGRDAGGKPGWIGPEGIAPFAWLAEDVEDSGISGDPRLASAAIGEKLVKHHGRILAEVIREARHFPLERLR